MANNNYLSNIIELNLAVIDGEGEKKYRPYTYGVARLMQESLENSTPEDLVDTLDYGVAIIDETLDIMNPVFENDVTYFTDLQKNLKDWKTSVDFANSLKV